MKPISKIGGDTGTPSVQDWQTFRAETLIPNYYHQPLIGRKLAGGRLIPASFDGKYVLTIPTLNDIDEPKYAKKPMENDIDIDGGVINFVMPQISQTINIDKDEVQLMFAGRARLPLAIQQMNAKIAEKEDKIVFRGDGKTRIVGLCNATESTNINSAGIWDVQDNSDGVLSHAIESLQIIVDAYVALGYPTMPIDVAMDSYVYTLLNTTFLHNAPFNSNLEIFLRMMNGGTIYVSNHVQSAALTKASTNHTLVAILRHPSAFTLVSSPIEQSQMQIGLWNWRYGLREKFSIKVLTQGMVQYMEDIDLVS